MPVKELRQVRLRTEGATPGNAATPRYVWRGAAAGIEDQREVVLVEEQIGIYGGTDRSYTPKLYAEIQLEETPAAFEMLAPLFQASGFGTLVSGLQGTAYGASGSAVEHRLAAPTTVHPVTYSFTIEAGDESWAQQLTYGLVKEFSLTFAGGEPVMVSSTWFGRNGTPANTLGTFSAAGAGTVSEAEVVLSSLGTVYLSPTTYGAGPVTAGNILGGELTFTPRWVPKYGIDAGALTFATAVYAGLDIEGNLTFEHWISGTVGIAGSAGQAEKWRAEQTQFLRIRVPGGTIPVGTTHTAKLLQIDLPIKFTTVDALSDQDGNDIVTANFVSKYSSASDANGRGTVVIVQRGTQTFNGA